MHSDSWECGVQQVLQSYFESTFEEISVIFVTFKSRMPFLQLFWCWLNSLLILENPHATRGKQGTYNHRNIIVWGYNSLCCDTPCNVTFHSVLNWNFKWRNIYDYGVWIKYLYTEFRCWPSQCHRQCLYKVSSRWCTHLGGDREHTNIYKALLILLLSSHIAWHRDIILAPNWLARGWDGLLFQTHVNYFQIVAKKKKSLSIQVDERAICGLINKQNGRSRKILMEKFSLICRWGENLYSMTIILPTNHWKKLFSFRRGFSGSQ